MTIFQAIIIAIIEGITEFLPISSTAHMRIAESLMGLSETDSFTKLFTIVIIQYYYVVNQNITVSVCNS